jgi:hypothetical protein
MGHHYYTLHILHPHGAERIRELWLILGGKFVIQSVLLSTALSEQAPTA